MNKNHNVKNEENSQEVYDAVSNLVSQIVDISVPSNSAQNPVTKTSNPKSIVDNKNQNAPSVRHANCSERPSVHYNQRAVKPTVEIYRAVGQFSESQSEIDVGLCVPRSNDARKNRNAQPMPCVPPSYSSVIKQGRPSLDIRRDVRSMEVQHLSPFSRIPPPSYAEIHGVWSREISNASSEQVLLGPDPIYIWCTHCATVVITVTQSQRSKFTHLTAAALCLFGCWPCAMLPYCMNSCKNIYHYCPECNYLFGMYRPW